MAIITLLTDFGLSDEYAGVMKGVILSISPQAVIVDLTHDIPPQDIVSAACILAAAWRYFPEGTIHLAVVDPGVGTGRAAVAAKIEGQFFLAPDNGLLTPIINRYKPEKVVRMENPAFFLKSVSQTFHGRDIFAPAAAHMAAGRDMADMGPAMPVEHLVSLEGLKPVAVNRGKNNMKLTGHVIYADHFGNLITNVDADTLNNLTGSNLTGSDSKASEKNWRIRMKDDVIYGISDAYGHVPEHYPLAIIGSRGYLEIAVCCGSAKDYYHVKPGEPVTVFMETGSSC